jgi:hypothetical protein
MATTEPQVFRYGQQVRIVACPQNHPDHVGQVGTVAQKGKATTTIRVHVGIGICRATVVEMVPVEPPSVAPQSVLWPVTRPGPGITTSLARSLDVKRTT